MQQKVRQKETLALIASDNYTSKAVLEALGSVMSNKYSEGVHIHVCLINERNAARGATRCGPSTGHRLQLLFSRTHPLPEPTRTS